MNTNTITLPETAAMKPAFQAPHEALHPGQINYQDFDNNQALKAASDANGYLWEGQAALNELRQQPNPEHSPAQHCRVVREALNSFSDNGAAKLQRAKDGLKSELARVEADLEKAANLKPDSDLKSAVIGTFQGMRPEQRSAALDTLINEGDGPTLAILINTSTVLTGLSPEQRNSIKLRLYSKVNPAGLALSQQLTKALAKAEAGSLANINGQALLRADTDRFSKKNDEARAIAAKANVGISA